MQRPRGGTPSLTSFQWRLPQRRSWSSLEAELLVSTSSSPYAHHPPSASVYFGCGFIEGLVSTYLAEIAPGTLRGTIVGLLNAINFIGNLWGTAMGPGLQHYTTNAGWQIAVGVQIIPAVLILGTVAFLLRISEMVRSPKQEGACHQGSRPTTT